MTGRNSSSCSCHHHHHHQHSHNPRLKNPEEEKGQKGHQKSSKEEENETETAFVPKPEPEQDETESETDYETDTEDSENVMELDNWKTDPGIIQRVRSLETKWKRIERGSDDTSGKNWWERQDFEAKLKSTATIISIVILGLCTIKYLCSSRNLGIIPQEPGEEGSSTNSSSL